MQLTHLGAKNCVTGSCHLLQTHLGAAAAGVNILVDCGSAYGNDPELPFDRFPVQPGEINYLFLTHAHIDHIGRVPDLIDAGFRGEIICTHATKALLIPMLHDAMSFSDRTGKEVHRLEELIDELSWGFEFHETFSLKQGIIFKLSNAGHILGSCFIRFEVPMDGTLGETAIVGASLLASIKSKKSFQLSSQETLDAPIHQYYPTPTRPMPVIFLLWNPPMEIETTSVERGELPHWKNCSIKPLPIKG